MPSLMPLQEGPHHKLLRNLNSACKVTNWIIANVITGKALSILFVLEMVIAKDIIISLCNTLRTQFQFDSNLSFKLYVLTT